MFRSVNGLVKRMASREAEEDLGAGDEGAKFLEQFAVFALEPFLDRFVLRVFPKPLLDDFVGGHGCPPTRVVRHSTRSLELPMNPGMWLVSA